MNTETKVKEIFKDIPNYEGFYKISDLGNVKSLERSVIKLNGISQYVPCRVLKQGLSENGYANVNLHKKGKGKTRTIHQLVAVVFLNHKPNGTQDLVINHINHNKLDNRLINLEITTQRENANKKHIKSTSKYTGVNWCNTRNRWMSCIRIKGKTKFLGRFKNEYDAHIAYQNKLKEYNKWQMTEQFLY